MSRVVETFPTSGVFADFLVVSFSPEASPLVDVRNAIVALGGTAARSDPRAPNREVWFYGDGGTVVLDPQPRWVRISFSGKALAELRDGLVSNALGYVIGLLGSEDHTVTQLDVAVDESSDGAARVARQVKRFPRSVRLSHKPVPTTRLLAARSNDGRSSGTWYGGKKGQHEVVAKVYDKAWEVLSRQGRTIEPTTRYEVSLFKGVKPCLADVLDPTPAFWHYASGTLLPRPDGVPAWERGRNLRPWQSSWVPAPPADRMTNLLHSSRDVEALASLARELGPGGRDWAIAEFTRALDYRLGLSPKLDSYAVTPLPKTAVKGTPEPRGTPATAAALAAASGL